MAVAAVVIAAAQHARDTENECKEQRAIGKRAKSPPLRFRPARVLTSRQKLCVHRCDQPLSSAQSRPCYNSQGSTMSISLLVCVSCFFFETTFGWTLHQMNVRMNANKLRPEEL